MFYVIRLWSLHTAFPESILTWGFCYAYYLCISDSSTSPILYLRLYLYVFVSYNGVCVDIFVCVIQYNNWLYFILVILFYISPMYCLLFYCIVITFVFVFKCFWMLYLCLMQYFVVLHTILSLVVLRIGKLFMNISCIWFVITLLPWVLTLIHKSVLTYIYFGLVFICI